MSTVRPARAPRAASSELLAAASIYLPIRFVIMGVVSLLFGTAALVIWPDLLATYHYNQRIIAITHLFTLGWICSVVMGATYQLVPVALETRLYSARLAAWHFILHSVGFLGIVVLFWRWDMKHAGYFGSLVAAGVLLYAWNLGRTLLKLRTWNVVAAAVAIAIAWLVLTTLAGLFITADKIWVLSFFQPVAQMHAHAHLGGLGFFVTMIVGVAYKLVPMFTLSELQSKARAWTSLSLITLGLAGLSAAVALAHPSRICFAVLIVAGLAVFGWELGAILHARKRRPLDGGLKTFLCALALLIPLSGMALVLTWPGLELTAFTAQLENVYGILALLGVVSLAIVGMLYKIVPFLVWYASYSKHIGRYQIPALSDLYSARIQRASFWLYLTGLAGLCGAALLAHPLAVRCAALVLAGGVGLFACNVGLMLRHLKRPALQPLPRFSTSNS